MFKWALLLLSPFAAISSKNWLLIWVMLEISSFSFIMFLTSENKKEITLMYFLVQSISSAFLLISVGMKSKSEFFYEENNFMASSLFIISIITKMGVVPMHMWMVEISRKMGGMNLFLFLTIQKIAPIIVATKNINFSYLITLIIMSGAISVLLQVACVFLAELLTYSSISHTGWMLFSSLSNYKITTFYFIVYALILMLIVKGMMGKSLKMISTSGMKSKSLALNLISLSGTPPLMGFIPKWLVLTQNSIQFNLKILNTILVLLSSLNAFIYIRILSGKIINLPSLKKNFSKSDSWKKSDFFVNLILPSIFWANFM
uniref:NADH-ubiquinone oxidoreductase chain 2 n=1 Tax=Hygrobates taniguchii TaxID=2759127 RepID=A0A6J4EE13_9ACAR|nr:NADH dehydrogenase subuinit 2 [Hygrobates taniguchii]